MPDEKFELADAAAPAEVPTINTESAEVASADPNVKTLQYPITFGGETISTVKTRRLKGKDMVSADIEARAIAGGNPGDMLLGLVSLAKKISLPYEAVAEMDMDDINALLKDDDVPLAS